MAGAPRTRPLSLPPRQGPRSCRQNPGMYRSATISARSPGARSRHVPRLDPHPLRSIIQEHAGAWPDTDIYVGCSGNFTIERVLHSRFENTRPVDGDDITAYSCALGWFLAGEDLPYTLRPEFEGMLGWLAPYMKDRADRLATLPTPTEMRCAAWTWQPPQPRTPPGSSAHALGSPWRRSGWAQTSSWTTAAGHGTNGLRSAGWWRPRRRVSAWSTCRWAMRPSAPVSPTAGRPPQRRRCRCPRPTSCTGGRIFRSPTRRSWGRRVTGPHKVTHGQKTANRVLANGRAPVEHGFAHLKNWRILTKHRTDPARAACLLRAVLVLTLLEVNR